MITITKKYHFYAAHRNETINDKCRSLHGHTYKLEVELRMDSPDNTGVTMLFSEIDRRINPIIDQLDHALLLNYDDPFKKLFMDYNGKNPDDQQKLVLFGYPTSAENLAGHLRHAISAQALNVLKLSLSETESSTVTIS